MRYKYDYLEEMKEDIKNWIDENIDYIDEDIKEDKDDLCDYLNDELFNNDSITGNASGSYFFNSWKAEEALMHNLDLLGEALEMFGDEGINILKNGAEWCDVTIRCYLLGSAIAEVLDELEDDGFFEKPKKYLFRVWANCCSRPRGMGIEKITEIEDIQEAYDWIMEDIDAVCNYELDNLDISALTEKDEADIADNQIDVILEKLNELIFDDITRQMEDRYNGGYERVLDCGDYCIMITTLESVYRPNICGYDSMDWEYNREAVKNIIIEAFAEEKNNPS